MVNRFKEVGLEFNIENLIPEKYISDWQHIRRTWTERLFSLPWRPLQKRKWVKNTQIIVWDGKFYCSYESYDTIVKHLKNEC